MENNNRPKFKINVKITNSSTCEETTFPYSKYILYNIKIFTNDRQWEIQRRYKNFDDLDQKLKHKKMSNLPKIPPKMIFPSNKYLKERQSKLQKYLNILLTREDVFKYNEIFEFMEMEKEQFLMLKDNIEEISTNENSPNSNDRFKSFFNSKKSKCTDVLIKENFFYSNYCIDSPNKTKKSTMNNFCTNFQDNDVEFVMRDLILCFLEKLNSDIKEKSKIIKEFENIFLLRKVNHVFQRDEVYRLLFGYNAEDGYLGGLIFHSGNIIENQIGAENCLEFLSKLIDYQHNTDCDFFINILRLAKLPQIKSLNLEEHIQSKRKKVIYSCYVILKNVINDEKNINIYSLICDHTLIDKFEIWLLS